jgi:hypothetical protein
MATLNRSFADASDDRAVKADGNDTLARAA